MNSPAPLGTGIASREFPRGLARTTGGLALGAFLCAWGAVPALWPAAWAEGMTAVSWREPGRLCLGAGLFALLALASFALVAWMVGMASALRCRVHRASVVLLLAALGLLAWHWCK